MAADPPTLVFAHYFGGSARSWTPLLHALGGSGEQIVPDLPGFGGTAPPMTLTLDTYADYLADRAGVRPWIAVGHSMGGKIALACAARRPSNLVGLVLIAASPPTPQPMSDDDRRASIEAFGNRQSARRQLTSIAGRLPPALLEICVEDELRVAWPAWRWWLEQGSRADISGRTHGLQLPVLIITGDDDRVLGSDTAAQIQRGLPNATLRTIADAGHMVPLEHPERVARLIRDFAAKIGGTAA
ncbi:MAG: alpha/beta fold hydrolase [Sphingomicrobium sp.]|nr:alpha/beta hydrolase [Sphingomonadales bacterium]